MTGWRKRTIMEMAREAGWDAHNAEFDTRIEAFAKLVRKDEHDQWVERAADLIRLEREACAKVCEDSNTWDLHDPNGFAANLIRARGQA